MNFSDLFSNFFERSRIGRWPKTKRIVIGIAGAISLLILLVIISNKPTSRESSFNKVTLMPKETPTPKKELNYEFIKFDTITIPNFAARQKPNVEKPKELEQIILAEEKNEPAAPAKTRQQSVKTTPTRPKVESMFPQQQVTQQSREAKKNPNMIVMNNLTKQPAADNGSTTPYTGKQSALVKVVLPNRTPVANGSLVEARVLRDAKWGDVFIPKRTKLIGVASLLNRRVNINFREIIINNVSRSCSGRAYDDKRLQGLPYSPVSSATKRALLDELRSAVSGVPVVGRMANRSTLTYNYNQDVSVLDEGLEFYVWINSIF